jgi:DNA-binding MurR/RpiR family transcriptional regulator
MAKLMNFIESSDPAKTEVVIAEYILRNVKKIPDMSIYELAEVCHTSPATITRFCRRFENITFKELKEYAREFIEFNDTEVSCQEREDHWNANQISAYYDQLIAALEETRERMDTKQILKVVHKIHRAERVSFFVVTFSHLVARNARFKMIRLGKNAFAYSSHEHQMAEAKALTAKDLAVVVSFSGETKFIIQLVKVLTRRKIPIIAITGNENSGLARQAEHVILCSNRKLKPFKSAILEEISLLSLINSIYLVYSFVYHENKKLS